MNKYQFHFGDYFADGHREYLTLHVKSPLSHSAIQEIINGIVRDYPLLESVGIAREYSEPFIEREVWDIIKEFGYPAERLIDALDNNKYENFTIDMFDKYIDTHELIVNAEAVADIWFWMLNTRGAQLEKTEADFKHFFFEDGYGCFWG